MSVAATWLADNDGEASFVPVVGSQTIPSQSFICAATGGNLGWCSMPTTSTPAKRSPSNVRRPQLQLLLPIAKNAHHPFRFPIMAAREPYSSLIRSILAHDAVIDRTRKLFDPKIVGRELQVRCRFPGLLHIK